MAFDINQIDTNSIPRMETSEIFKWYAHMEKKVTHVIRRFGKTHE